MSDAPNPFFLFDPTRMMDLFKVPPGSGSPFSGVAPGGMGQGMDMQALMDTQRRAFEALADANRVAAEGYQGVMARQVDIMRETLDTVSGALADLSRHTNPADAAQAQLDLSRQAVDRAYASLRELTELTNEANTRAFQTFQDRMAGLWPDTPSAEASGAGTGEAGAPDQTGGATSVTRTGPGA